MIHHRLPDRSIIYCNAAWAAGHDLRPADIVGHTFDDPLVVDDVPRPAPNATGQWVEWGSR